MLRSSMEILRVLREERVDLGLVADLCAVGIKRRATVTSRDSTKWHVTSLLRAGRDIVRGNVSYSDGVSVPDNITAIMNMGRIWESSVDCYLSHYAARQGGLYTPDVESVQEGIIASLDGVMWLPDLGWMVSETKLRFTLREDISAEHLQQVRAYCHCVGTNLVCFVSGHIATAPPDVRMLLRILRFPQQSVDDCWQGIVNTKNYLISRGITPDGRTDGES